MAKDRFAFISIGIPFLLTVAIGLVTLKVMKENQYDHKLFKSVEQRKTTPLDNDDLKRFINPDYEPISLQDAIQDAQRNASYKQDYEMIPMRAGSIPTSIDTKVVR